MNTAAIARTTSAKAMGDNDNLPKCSVFSENIGMQSLVMGITENAIEKSHLLTDFSKREESETPSQLR
jgi:hypothetical protein